MLILSIHLHTLILLLKNYDCSVNFTGVDRQANAPAFFKLNIYIKYVPKQMIMKAYPDLGMYSDQCKHLRVPRSEFGSEPDNISRIQSVNTC